MMLGLSEHVMVRVLEKRPYALLLSIRQNSFCSTVYDVLKALEVDLILNINFLFLWLLGY